MKMKMKAQFKGAINENLDSRKEESKLNSMENH